MSGRLLGRLVKLPAQVCVALALLSDAPQQLELGTRTSEMLASLRVPLFQADVPDPRPEKNLASRGAAVVVDGVAWLATLSLPYAEPPSDR